jgi:hypothetical protein
MKGTANNTYDSLSKILVCFIVLKSVELKNLLPYVIAYITKLLWIHIVYLTFAVKLL